MQDKLVLNVIDVRTREPKGYIKSVMYDTGRCSLASKRKNAKKYNTEYEVQCDIDVITPFLMEKGYFVFYK